MLSEKMGRRRFLKRISSALLGIATVPIWKAGHASEKIEKTPVLEYRTLGKTGLKVTTVSMGVMNCSDPAVLLRAFDLGINFYDTADCYMNGRNEEMVGKPSKESGKKCSSRRRSMSMMKRKCELPWRGASSDSERITLMFWYGTITQTG